MIRNLFSRLHRSRPMRRLASFVVLVVSLVAALPAQSLADVIPADTLLYARLVDPIGDFEKLTSSGDVWARPDKVASKARKGMERGFKQADQGIGLQDGTMDSWMRSIGSIELALFSFDFDGESLGFGGTPTLDFAAIVESPLAIEMYNQFSGMLIDSGRGTRNERGDIVMDIGGDQQPLFSVQGTRMILAGSESRLSKVVAAFKEGRDVNPLSASAAFKTVCAENAGARVVYARMGPVLRFISEKLDEDTRSRMDNVLKPLDMYDIEAVGYREDGPNGIVTMKGGKDVNLFKLLKGNVAPPALQGLLPEDTAFALGHAGNFGEHYGRIEKFLVDPATFPFAMFVSGGLTALTMQSGLAPKALTEPVREGFATALVPDENGNIEPENALVILTKVPDRAEADKLMDRVGKAYARGKNMAYARMEEGGVLWMKPVDPPTSQPAAESQPAPQGDAATPTESRPREFRSRRRSAARAATEAERNVLGAWVNGYVVMGKSTPVKKVVASLTGKAATLASTGAYNRLPPQATFYINAGLRSIFASAPGLSGSLSFLKGTQAIGIAAVATDTTVTITSNRATGQLWGIFAGAGAASEGDREGREGIMAALTEVGTRTRNFAKSKKAWPKSMADLGYTANNVPSFPDGEGKMKPIVFLPPKGEFPKEGSEEVAFYGKGGSRILLAYWDSSDMGRLAVALDGGTWGWSESEFIGALRRYNGN